MTQDLYDDGNLRISASPQDPRDHVLQIGNSDEPYEIFLPRGTLGEIARSDESRILEILERHEPRVLSYLAQVQLGLGALSQALRLANREYESSSKTSFVNFINSSPNYP